MGFIKNLFGKKEEKVEEVKQETEQINNVEQIAQCEACKQPILTTDKIRTFNKNKYHLKCFRANMKLMRKQVWKT